MSTVKAHTAAPGSQPRVQRLISQVYPLLVILAIWELVARMQWVDPLFLPPFSASLRTMVTGLIGSRILLLDAAYSLWRAFAGLAIGGGIGVLTGMLMARYPRIDQFVDPIVAALFPTPKLALFPLLMVWLGLGESSKVALIAISAFFPVTINTYAGMRSVDKFLIWNALSKGANNVQLLTRVMIPAATPFIFAGWRVATSFSFLLAVASEMLSANNGLGYRILFSQRTYEPEMLYAALLLVASLGFTVDRLVGLLGRRLLVWQESQEWQ